MPMLRHHVSRDFTIETKLKQTKLHGLSPRANYTDESVRISQRPPHMPLATFNLFLLLATPITFDEVYKSRTFLQYTITI
jgi:hypothetical protein